MTDMNDIQCKLTEALFDVGAVMDRTRIHPTLNPEGKGFKLKLHETNPDAPLSPFYLNLRTPDNPKPGPLTPEIIERIGSALYDKADRLAFWYNCVVGVPRAGEPLAEAFYRQARVHKPSSISLLRLSKEETAESRRISGVIEGEYTKGDPVLLIDDLITRAHSKIEAITELQRAGLCVSNILVVVDREQGGKEELVQRGHHLHALLTVNQMFRFYFEIGRIHYDIYHEIIVYLQRERIEQAAGLM
jgi:uridine monophosphate synthetase